MSNPEQLSELFETQRGHLRGVAYRMLGSLTEADDAVQEAWLRLNRSSADEIQNLGGWLTTVVARVCLDMLRSRKARREEELESHEAEPLPSIKTETLNPEQEALMADSVGLALLVVLDTLSPAERVAFVLHDVFDLSFDEIAPIVGRTETATRQLASRARRRVRTGDTEPAPILQSQRVVVDAFLTALRAGDFEGLLAVLDPDVVVRADAAAIAGGGRAEIHGARNWARGAVAFSRMARFVELALIDGKVGLVMAPGGHLSRVLTFTVTNDKIVEAQIIGDPVRLQQLQISTVE
ncbi:MAG TPA: sigma-70 family RNA polymerase sigma factor [Pyrinomonadaceae bacterium]|nr:sigma-70 family RNA polymerase sigma factor [Pyrinomonadaceae bacterium]